MVDAPSTGPNLPVQILSLNHLYSSVITQATRLKREGRPPLELSLLAPLHTLSSSYEKVSRTTECSKQQSSP